MGEESGNLLMAGIERRQGTRCIGQGLVDGGGLPDEGEAEGLDA